MNLLFTAVGEILIDFTSIVEAGKTIGFRMHAGGSPYNVAVGLARMGARVEFAGKVSTDIFGRFLVGRLQRERIGTRFLSRSPAPSTLAFVTLESGHPVFSFYGEKAADTQLRPEDLTRGIEETEVLHFGSISLLVAPTSETITGLVDRLRGRTLLSCDPNIRPGLIGDPGAYRRLLHQVFQAADIVKLSAADAQWLMPGYSTEAAAETLLALGPALVVVTLGANGCYALSLKVQVRLPAPAVQVVDTVGAGDAFTSGLLLRLTERGLHSRDTLEEVDAATLDEVLRFATTAASLTCTRTGADPPRREEIEMGLKSREC